MNTNPVEPCTHVPGLVLQWQTKEYESEIRTATKAVCQYCDEIFEL